MEQDVSNKLNWHMGIKREKKAEKRHKEKQELNRRNNWKTLAEHFPELMNDIKLRVIKGATSGKKEKTQGYT